jgi:transcriptional regulator with XRE-family HTH domain
MTKGGRLERERRFDARVGTHIFTIRKRRELTQKELAKLVDMSNAQLCRIEKGQRTLTAEQLRRIAVALSVNMPTLTRPITAQDKSDDSLAV